jgi:glycosyltransferase involved in cell wall biosynthesis
LQRRGHDVRVFSRAPVEPHPEVPTLEVGAVGNGRPMVVAQNVVEAVRDFRPTDVILQYTAQMWNAWRFGSPATIWLATRLRRAGARVTVIAHELHVPWSARPDLSLAAMLQRLQFAALLRSCDRAFVTTSTRAAAAASLCRLLHVDVPGVLRIGPNVLPLERHLAQATDGQLTSPQIGFFSTAAIGKRFDVVLDAFARIALEIPAATLVLMGDLGPPDQPRVKEVMAEIARHPAQERIRMTGRLSLAEISRQLSTLDLYLFPMETGANTRSGTLPAALGSGIPTVAVFGRETDSLLFRHDDNLVFADGMSGAAFAEASLRLLRDPALRQRVGQGGRNLYEAHLTWERAVDQLLADS